MNPNEAARQLADALAATPEFAQLKNTRRTIAGNRQFASQLSAFEQKQKQAYTGNLSQAQTQQLMNQLTSDYNSLYAIPEMKQYFDAGEKLNHLVGSALEAVTARVDTLLQS